MAIWQLPTEGAALSRSVQVGKGCTGGRGTLYTEQPDTVAVTAQSVQAVALVMSRPVSLSGLR